MNIQNFINEKFGSIRIVTEDDGKEWFVAKDIAICLGYKNTNDTIRKHVNEEYKKNFEGRDLRPSNNKTRGGLRHIMLINESGVYQLIMSSKLPDAKEFQKWVFEEVLPSIRKYGTYINTDHETIRDVVKLHNTHLRSSLFQLANYINKYYQEHKSEIPDKKDPTTFTKQILTTLDEGCGITVGERDKADTEKLRYLLAAELEAIKIISDGFYYNEKPDKILNSLNNLRFKFENLRNGNDFERSDYIE